MRIQWLLMLDFPIVGGIWVAALVEVFVVAGGGDGEAAGEGQKGSRCAEDEACGRHGEKMDMEKAD
jgi:hypothetical protein